MNKAITVSSSKLECTRLLPSSKRKVDAADACTETEESETIVMIKRTKRFRQNEIDIEEIEEERVLFDN